MNKFAGVITSATEAIASGLDTRTKGNAIVVYNPLNIQREDVVEADVAFPGGAPRSVRVYGPDGTEVPAQLAGAGSGTAKVVFLANVPSVGYTVSDVEPSSQPLLEERKSP